MELAWWHWAVGGIALIIAELAIPTFWIIWFGVGALTVALVMAVADISLTAQLTIWLVMSISSVVGWFKLFKPALYKTRTGMSGTDLVGEIGILVRDVAPFSKGQVRFQKPILGTDMWECVSDEEVKSGERVKVLEVSGSFIKVKRH